MKPRAWIVALLLGLAGLGLAEPVQAETSVLILQVKGMVCQS
jgi:hypothetical protein